ncbi:MAG TPA: O-antigen ligase family protein [Acidobacteriaceae bacterium]|jgi:O-antigen ligase|nr:O-antigen ligase family protein [Acidobacteriaceae bacterium]
MFPLIATGVYCIGIWVLLRLARDSKRQISPALWIPVLYLLINGSRPVSMWLQLQVASSPEQLLEGSPLDASVALALILAGAVVLLSRRKLVLRIILENPALVVFVLYCAISICWSDYPGVALKRWVRSLGDFIMVLIMVTEADRIRAIRVVLTRTAFILIPLSILIIRYYPSLGRSYDRWTGRMFVSGVAADKNMLGMVLMVYGLGSLWQIFLQYQEPRGPKRRRQMIAQGAVLAMAVWLLTQADSMTSASCFLMGALVLAVVSLVKASRKPPLVHCLAIGAVGAAFSVLFLHVGEADVLHQMGRNSSLTGRTEIWAGLLRFRGSPWIGTGFDSYWLGDRLDHIWAAGGLLRGINEAHNGYLETYLTLGWVGVALLAVLIVTGYRNVLVALRRDPEAGKIRLAFLVIAIIYNFTEAGFRIGDPIWFVFLLAITALPASRLARSSHETAAVSGGEQRTVGRKLATVSALGTQGA